MSIPLKGSSLRLFLFAALAGWVGAQPLSVVAQNGGTVTISNTAKAGFTGPNGQAQQVGSNQTTFPARVGQAGLEIVKTGDRASAEPGDTIIYRLLIRNTGTATLQNFQITDTLPLGLKFIQKSPKAAFGNTPVALGPTTTNGRTVTFTYPGSLAPKQTLNLVYAALLTPDAIRGNGRNLAVASATTPGGLAVSSNTSSHRLEIRPGILSDCGTIVGRVFVDKNFDGEQQPGEPGVPNAVIYMDDGNRITTDANGLFSLAYVISGYRTGTLDLSSLPGYTLAPNRYRIEANSTSRLVKLEPGGMARMNFAVTPSFKEGQR